MAFFERKKAPAKRVYPAELDRMIPGAPEPSADGLRSVSQHQDFLLSITRPLMPFGMRLLDAWGLSLCEDLLAESPMPAVPEAGCDGFAVKASSVNDAGPAIHIKLAVRDELTEEGSAVPVAAGQHLPDGADAVLPLSQVAPQGRDISVLAAVSPGAHIRQVGTDAVTGSVLASAGTELDARMIGLLAEAGFDKVFCRPRPRIVVLAVDSHSGNVDAKNSVGNGDRRRRDAASHMIAAAAKAAGAQVWRESVPGNSIETITEAISDQLIRADLLITCGGLAGGRRGIVAQAIKDLGRSDFAEVSLKPGDMQGFGIIGHDHVPLLMLSSDPVMAYVAYQAFGFSLIRRLMGAQDVHHANMDCLLARDISTEAGSMQFLPGTLSDVNGRAVVTPLNIAEGLTSLSRANVLIVVPEMLADVKAGATVTCWPLGSE